MKRVLSLLLAVLMILSVNTVMLFAEDAEQPVQSVTYFEGETAHKPVVLNTNGTEQVVWSGDVALTAADERGAAGFTLVYRLNGAAGEIDPGNWDFTYTTNKNGTLVSKKISDNNYFYSNTWSGLTYRSALHFEGNGIYYTYINMRMTNNSEDFYTGIQEFRLFKSGTDAGGVPSVISNPNDNATLQMLAIVKDNLEATVTFFDDEGYEMGTASVKYTNGPTDKSWEEKKELFFGHGKVMTPNELLETVEGAVVPSKEADDQYRYRLIWKDADGNVVDGIYKSGELYASFEAIDNNVSTVTFLNGNGAEMSTSDQLKGAAPVYNGLDPVKEESEDETYTFKGWSHDGETVVDLAQEVLSDNEVTYYPVFVADAKLKATVELPAQIAMGDTVEATIALNRTDLTADVLAGAKEPITGGEVTVQFNAAAFTVEGAVDGKVTVPFTAVAQDGTTNVVLNVTASDVVAGTFDFTVVSGKASTETLTDIAIYSTGVCATITGQQTGAYFADAQPVAFYRDTETSGPNSQTLWKGEVFTGGSDGVTFVYKIDGVQTPINASNLNVILNGGTYAWNSWNWQNGGNTGGMISAEQIFEEDGYYFMYLNCIPNGGFKYKTVNQFQIYQYSGSIKGPDRTNTNENATFTMLAIVADNLQPTVTYHDANGEVIGTYTHKYTAFSGSMWTAQAKTVNVLITPEELLEINAGEAPEKVSDIAKITYEFDGWVDADGNKVDVLYMSGDLYPSYKTIDNRSKYTVEFVNADEAKTVLQSSEVPEDVLPVYTGETPKLPSTDTKSYVFKGWDKEIVKTPVTDKYDGALVEEKIVYTATFEEVERRYDVTYYDEDGETKLGEVLNIIKGQAANFEVVPTKEADAQNTYTFEKWVAMDGSDVDLTRVEADLSVKAQYKATLNKYTVTFMSEDKSEQIATSTVDYGTAAQAPEVTKDPEPEKHIAYEFDAWVDAEGNAVDVTNVTGDVTVYATFKNVLTHEFTDLNESAWYMGAVKYALQNGLMSGMSDTSFAPDATMTRAQFATVLYNREGKPDVSEMEDPDLPDYNPDAWWANAFKWAYNAGIINGSNINGVDMLDPDGTVTRLQIATMLYRYADKVFRANDGSVGLDMTEFDKMPPTSLADFQDKNDINYSTKEARWAYNREYITGMTKVEGQKPYFAPSDGATRAQVITILMRFLEDTEHHGAKGTIVVEH